MLLFSRVANIDYTRFCWGVVEVRQEVLKTTNLCVSELTNCTFYRTISCKRRSPSMSESTYTMAEKTFTISEIREAITRLPEQFEHEPEAVAITRHGKPVMAILPWELYESIMETLEVMG